MTSIFDIFFGNCIELLTRTQRHCALDCSCCAFAFYGNLLGFFSKLTYLSTAFQSPRWSWTDLKLSTVSLLPLDMIKCVSSVRAGAIYTPPGTAVCVLRSICYHKVNEVNHQESTPAFQWPHTTEERFFRGALLPVLCVVCASACERAQKGHPCARKAIFDFCDCRSGEVNGS